MRPEPATVPGSRSLIPGRTRLLCCQRRCPLLHLSRQSPARRSHRRYCWLSFVDRRRPPFSLSLFLSLSLSLSLSLPLFLSSLSPSLPLPPSLRPPLHVCWRYGMGRLGCHGALISIMTICSAAPSSQLHLMIGPCLTITAITEASSMPSLTRTRRRAGHRDGPDADWPLSSHRSRHRRRKCRRWYPWPGVRVAPSGQVDGNWDCGYLSLLWSSISPSLSLSLPSPFSLSSSFLFLLWRKDSDETGS